jgi:hypothetical protein
MRISIPDDFEDLPSIRRERPPEPSRQPEPLLEPGPFEQRFERLREQASQKNFPEIPRRQYERKIAPSPEVNREPGERHVRSRNHLSLSPLLHVRLRPEEKLTLAETGRFRVLALKDVVQTIYSGDERAARSDLRYLQKQGLVTLDIVNARRDGRARPVERFEVVSLTEHGERAARVANRIEPGQRLYHGLVKPREVEHDSQIYRAYRKEAEKIQAQGGEHLRVRLDFELKALVQKAIYQLRKSEPERDMDSIKEEIAEQQQLPFVDHQIQIPDARIEYDLDQGGRTGFSDIEVVTAAYHPGHLRSKVQAGFRLYASSSDHSTISARAEGDHRLLDRILDL